MATLNGNDGADTLNGNPTDDTLYGNGGNDSLDGGSDADHMEGGLGNDTYSVDNADDLVVEAANAGDDSAQASISYTLTDSVDGSWTFSLSLPPDTFVDVDGDSLTYTAVVRITGTNDAPLITASVVVMPQVSDNHSLETAFHLDGQFVLGANPHVTDAQTVPWESLSATGSEAFDYYVFNVTQPGTTATFDTDYGLGFNSILSLFDAAGNFLDYSGDA